MRGGVIAGVACWWCGGRVLRRLGIVGMMALGAGAGVLRGPGLGLTDDPLLLLGFQSLHALTFGAMHLGAMAFIQQAVPTRLLATAQALYASLSMGVVVGLTTMASGLLSEALGGRAFLAMRSEEHTSELQSLMRISYAILYLQKNKRR